MTFTAAASSSVADISPVLVQSQGYQSPSKIVRMIVDFQLSVSSINANPQQLGVGIWVVQHEGLTGDGAADVLNDFQQDFYYWTTQFLAPDNAADLQRRWSIDIRTSRRLRGGYGLLFKAQNPV